MDCLPSQTPWELPIGKSIQRAEPRQPRISGHVVQRGRTLVVFTSEFGRSPWSQNTTGRDHNPKGYSSWFADGGIKGGTVHGATDEYGYKAVENPHYYSDLHATILKLMGLDHKKMQFRTLGRAFHLVEEGYGPIEQIIA